MKPDPIPGNPFGWRCPQCHRRLPDSTETHATRVLDQHLTRCTKVKKEITDGL